VVGGAGAVVELGTVVDDLVPYVVVVRLTIGNRLSSSRPRIIPAPSRITTATVTANTP
jgi:hypothetical protein